MGVCVCVRECVCVCVTVCVCSDVIKLQKMREMKREGENLREKMRVEK